MKLTKALGGLLYKAASFLAPVNAWGWWPRVLESYAGAWQANVTVDKRTVSENWAVFACATLIANDISKMLPRVMQFNQVLKVWEPTIQRPVLRKPNRYQTRIEFFKCWIFSLLFNGNTYVLKERDRDGFIVALYILDPNRVIPLVAPDGSIYYQLRDDQLAKLEESIVVPASEIIHDRMHTLFHPLVGVSPIYACGVAAMQSAAIQDNSAKFFQNMSRPSGILTAPGAIDDATATRLKTAFEAGFSGDNFGKLAVVGDGLKYESMTVNAEDSQMIEQLKFTGEIICATFHVPPYKLGLGPMPTVNNTSALNQQYYDQCLQPIVENMELRLDEGLELTFPFETWFDTSALLRMDQATRLKSHIDSISGGLMAPNEARRQEELPPVAGGDSPFMQQQNWTLEQLAKREPPKDAPVTPALPAPQDEEDDTDEQARAMVETILKGLTEGIHV